MIIHYGGIKPVDCLDIIFCHHGEVLSFHGLLTNITRNIRGKLFGKVNKIHVAAKQHQNLAVAVPQSIHNSVLSIPQLPTRFPLNAQGSSRRRCRQQTSRTALKGE
ncbi:hypothetical protein [Affinirhizobium pseudoryzae]|uniref:hypothetical protein n=1 Tax=Allorhizobium pseudoryzae TaxID=379684 RepID=UPI0013EA6953|nr:hypothetical protein [Allorhizobium pseudoryzae]